MAETTIVKDDLKDKFLSNWQNIAPLAQAKRAQAQAALASLSLPTKRWEAWKYTRLDGVLETSFQAASPAAEISDLSPFDIPELEADRLVFVNGSFVPALSSVQHNQALLSIAPISELQGEALEQFEQHFASVIEPERDIFTAANTAYAQDGVFIYLKNNTQAAAPIEILNLVSGDADQALQQRNLFVVGKNAEAKVVERFYSLNEAKSLRTGVTEIVVGENASLEYVILQAENDQASQINWLEVTQAASSRFAVYTLSLSGAIIRNNLQIRLEGENIESNLMGTYLIDGTQHVDNHTQVDHIKPHCYSNELYKGIIADRATGVFNGRIHVYEDAQKTNAFQSNRNVLLSDNANIFTKPQLEIYADDVKCSHGATTGKLDEDAIFYLQARGIKLDDAKRLLINAFANEVIEDLSIEPVKAYLSDLIENRF